MIEQLRLLRNVSTFDNVSAGANLPLTPVSLIYAENARGKTTLAAILRSLGKSDPNYILERARLGAPAAPHIVITGQAGEQAVFQNGAWIDRFGDIAVFDDTFVAENVCSGLSVEKGHRQNLHELIIGPQGAALSRALQTQIDRIEEHNRALQRHANAIPAGIRGGLSVDEFCALEPLEDVEAAIQAAERNLAAAAQANAVKQQAEFSALSLPPIDLAPVSRVLERGLPELETDAADRVQAHLATLGEGGESWVADGMTRIDAASGESERSTCPFCAQDLGGSALITHYQAYFGDAYQALRDDIAGQITDITTAHRGEVQAAFERSVRIAIQSRQFWSQFVDIPEINIDTASIVRAWLDARNAVIEALRRKQSSPLDQHSLDSAVQEKVDWYEECRAQIAVDSARLLAINEKIAIAKEGAAAADENAIKTDLNRLKAVQSRFDTETAQLCAAYLQEKANKGEAEQLRNAAREELNEYRESVFSTYEGSINNYLNRLYAGFRLSSVNSVNTRSGSTCNYSVLINEVEVPLAAQTGAAPSFKNTLSAGDRNALALAFFFSSLERDPNRSEKIVVIDDPMTSLDEHRSLTTIQELRRLAGEVKQLIVLSHSKPFLCALWEGMDKDSRTAIRVVRHNSGSTLEEWDVNQDCITEHDKRHQLVRGYIAGSNSGDERAVAAALRHILEAFIRVAFPEFFPPGAVLGEFVARCRQKENTADQIMSAQDRQELDDLREYANQFHHDTNPAYQTVDINDTQLLGFSQRTLAFASRP